MLAIPHPGFGVDGFTNGSKQTQTGQIVLGRGLLAKAHQAANGGRGRVEDGCLVLLHHTPEAVGAWIGRGALEENTGGSSHQGAVDNVAVPGHPADISCTPVHVIRLDVKDELGGGIDAHGVAALYVHHTLWLAGTATGVEDIEHVLTVHHFAGHHRVLRHVNEQVIQIVIPPLLHRRSSAQSAYDEHRLHGWCFRHGLISDTLELNRFATAQPPISGNDQFGIGIVDALTQRAGGKAAEDDGVRGTDAGTG